MDGRLGLTTLCELRDVLHEQTLEDVLARAAGCTEEQVKRLVATLRPQGGSGPERATIVPVSEELSELRATVTRVFVEDLDKARAALSHVVPGGELVHVLHECLRVTLRACERRRRGTGTAQRRGGGARGRYVAAAVRDAVWRRDEGCCAFVGEDGRRCRSTYQVEIHHVRAWALGGAGEVDNLSLRCAQHNRMHAERDGLSARRAG